MSMEDTLDGLKAFIVAGIETKLLEIESERSVTIPRCRTGDIDVGFIESGQVPNISIVPSDTVPDYSDDSAPLIEPWWDDNVSALIEYKGSPQKTVLYALMRYAQAITEMILEDRHEGRPGTCGGRFEITQIDGISYASFIDARDTKAIRQVIDLRLLVREYRST